MSITQTPPPAAPAESRSTIGVLLALLIATVLKVLWASTSIGSVDAVLFYEFGAELHERGLAEEYRQQPMFNHTPLTATLLVRLYRATKPDETDVPASIPRPRRTAMLADMHLRDFTFAFRLLPIGADILVVLTLLRIRRSGAVVPWPILGLFALSPVSLMISGFHGNLDSVMTAFLFLAAAASFLGRPIASALLLALACHIKVAPLAFAPLFFFHWLPRGKATVFTTTTVAGLLAGFAPVLFEAPAPFLRNVLGYGSYWGNWGFTLLLRWTGWEAVQELDFLRQTSAERAIMQVLKIVVLAGMAFIGWRRRALPSAELFRTFACAWLWFFIFAPGVGVQYFVWIAPFLLLATTWGYVALTIAATIALSVFYHTTSDGQFPWVLANPRVHEHWAWAVTGLACWGVCVAILCAHARRWLIHPPRSAPATPVQAI
jgi:hypothetical protein